MKHPVEAKAAQGGPAGLTTGGALAASVLPPVGPSPEAPKAGEPGEELTLDGPNVVWYADVQTLTSYSQSLASPSRSIVQGERTADGGCRFVSSGPVIRPGSGGWTTHEIAYDPDTCRSLVVAGPKAVASLAGDGQSAVVPVPPGITWFGHARGWYDDPPNADVTVVRNSIGWGTASGCAVQGAADDELSWLWETLWTLRDTNFIVGAGDCQWAWNSTYAHFRNSVFCAFFNTDVYADRNWVYGGADGTIYGEFGWHKSGGCNWLLSFHSEYDYGW